jgi:lipopolysaccharide/colanic/teichoic acid biosynthesis glycosyltransferase
LFRREVARSDRNGRPLSLVVLIPTEETARNLPRLAKTLAARVRITDCVGFLDSQRLAVLLTETEGSAAWRFADDVLSITSRLGLGVNCAVYSYPQDWLGIQHDGTRRGNVALDEGSPLTRSSPALRSQDDHGDDSDDNDFIDRPIRAPAPDDDDAKESRPRREANREGGIAVAERRVATRRASVVAKVRTLPTKEGRSLLALPRQHVEGLPIQDLAQLLVRPIPLWKRAMDIAVAASLLILLLPLFVVIAIAIKLDSAGPVIFAQQRAGRGGRPFKFYKFRSMRVTAESERAMLLAANEQDGPVFKIRNDPRITRVGRWIRKTSLDELPQLWNVLKGDMTLVGPRPPTLDELPSYENWQRRRLDVIGGITCSWQVSGRNEIGFSDWVRMDLRYARRASLAKDLSLLAKTVVAVGTMRGAY